MVTCLSKTPINHSFNFDLKPQQLRPITQVKACSWAGGGVITYFSSKFRRYPTRNDCTCRPSFRQTKMPLTEFCEQVL